MFKKLLGNLMDPGFIIAVVVLVLAVRALETRNVLGLGTLVAPKA